MGKLKGILPISGTFGELSFVQTAEDGIIVKRKGGVSGKRIAKDPRYALTRLNNLEFGRAGKSAGLLYGALRMELAKPDSRAFSRLVQAVTAAQQADATSSCVMRSIDNGNAAMLQGFEFNQYASLDAVLKAPHTATVNRTAGTLSVAVPAFSPLEGLNTPADATHFRISATGIAAHFSMRQRSADTVATALLPVAAASTAAISLAPQPNITATDTLFLTLGISFYQEVNGVSQPMANQSFSALAIVAVDPV